MESQRLTIVPINIGDAKDFVTVHHRHHSAPVSGKFAIGLSRDGEIVGAIIVGRPVARHADTGWVAEVTRCCVKEGTPNGCSMLYGAAWRCARAMGYRRLITYTLPSEPGTSLKASGWEVVGESRGGTWNREGRPRIDKHPLQGKIKWEIN